MCYLSPRALVTIVGKEATKRIILWSLIIRYCTHLNSWPRSLESHVALVEVVRCDEIFNSLNWPSQSLHFCSFTQEILRPQVASATVACPQEDRWAKRSSLQVPHELTMKPTQRSVQPMEESYGVSARHQSLCWSVCAQKRSWSNMIDDTNTPCDMACMHMSPTALPRLLSCTEW